MKKVIFFRSNIPNNLKAKLIFLLFSIIATLILIFTFFITIVVSAVLLPIGLILLPKMIRSIFRKQSKIDIIEVTNYKQITGK